jgi:hypothetical protein
VVLLAVEVVFVSDVVGAGVDWPIATGISDVDSIATLRRLQRKLAGKRPVQSWRERRSLSR